jgi:Prokaryotic cytochrome b561
MALKTTSDHYETVAVSIHWSSVVLILILIASGFGAANAVDPATKAAILRVHVAIAVAVLALMILRIVWCWGLRSETYSGCRIATLAEAYRPGGACPFLHHHPGNDCKRPRNDGAERRSATHLWWRRRAAAGFLEVSAPATARHRSAASASLGRPSRWCGSLSSSCRSPRRSALAHVLQ